MNIYQKLALLTDDEAKLCLNGILKGLMSRKPQYEILFASKEQMLDVVNQIALDSQQDYTSAINDIANQNEKKAIRVILAEIAENSRSSSTLEAWFSTARPKLLEPVTSALVLAGIILVLSTEVSIEYENENGKKNLKVKIDKKSTPVELLKNFFSFFS